VFPFGDFPRIVGWDARVFPDWERGIGMTPETAVAVAAAQLAGTGARVTEVPEAFTLVVPPLEPSQHAMANSIMVQTHMCSRWRLTVDRPVVLRGMTSGQLVRTRIVYVARSDNGCAGIPTIQIPRPTQPATLKFWFAVPPVAPRDSTVHGRRAEPSPHEMRPIALRVTEPIWFEEARLRP
jgi:hypothetical protein